FSIVDQLGVEEFADGGSGNVIVCRSQSAGYDNDIMYCILLLKCVENFGKIIADSNNAVNLNTNPIQLLSDKRCVCVDDLSDKKLVTDGNNDCFHVILTENLRYE